MRIANVTEIKSKSQAAGSKFAQGFKAVATSQAAREAARAGGVVIGGAALLGLGVATFKRTVDLLA